ncbi:cobalamin-dependent protein [Micromonospora sp. NPDC002296]|uniref:cobalamin B12-binding domain-containing protein n=1 Tax=Micromonospora sp. NPDC002296 TaxID=3154271 RepID=UPI0033222E85
MLLTTLQSDSHTWNLVFLQLHLEGLGYEVVNLGPCVPDELIVQECRRESPDLIVISTVNGHGASDGMRVIREIRRVDELADTVTVIGGKLGTQGQQPLRVLEELADSGFDAVFDDSIPVEEFDGFVRMALDGRRALVGSDGAGPG